VPSYYIKISEGCFVWAATLLRGGPYSKNEYNSLRGAKYRWGSNPARIKAREKRYMGYFFSNI
jgi:hypothetical protein